MTKQQSGIATRTATLVENHSLLASLLAILCLVFAVNYFLAGPGSDGGSGLGGTGKFGGESGLGGTGKGPDSGPGFKLGATDSADENDADFLTRKSSVHNRYNEEKESAQLPGELAANTSTTPEFDVNSLRLTPETTPAPTFTPLAPASQEIARLVTNITLEDADVLSRALNSQREEIAADTLVSSLDILNSLMLAEAETRLALAANAAENDAAIRHRIAVPVRPERPDRLSIPARINAIQRVDVPAPPPVRPMRTLSTVLNR